MIHRFQFQTTSYAVQLGNALTWLKNRKTQLLDLTATQSEAIRCILKRSEVKDVTAADLMEALQLSQSTVETEAILLRGMTPQEQAEFRRLLQKALANVNAVRMREGCRDER